jgi:hypothetical protein
MSSSLPEAVGVLGTLVVVEEQAVIENFLSLVLPLELTTQ